MGRFQRQPIKSLTLLGFTFVALPLIIALFHSVIKIHLLSGHGVAAIYRVAKLIEDNKKLSEQLTNMERSAGQYLVLKDLELKQEYINQYISLSIFIEDEFNLSNDYEMSILIDRFQALNQQIFAILSNEESEFASLSMVQKNFELLNLQGKLLQKRNEELISLQAGDLQLEAYQVSSVILQSLIVIPIALLIAIVFFNLITQPLRQLKPQIKQLAEGRFDREIQVQGSQEIIQIADTLESMRVRLRALELQKSSFIRHISHELKTPLATIREGVELLYDNSVGPLNKEQQEINNIIRDSVARLQKLIEDLLNFNIVLDSTSLQDKQQVELRAVVKQAINDRQLDIKRKQLVLNLSLPAIGLISNRQHLRVIIENLLSNAIKYAPEQSVISLQAEIKNNYLYFTLSDKGQGIDKAQQEKIFDAFYQGTPPEDYKIKGSGLGLTIVKELIMRLNGDIKLINSDVGACFQIILPHAKLIDPSHT